MVAYKVVIADDEPIVRKAMQALIDWEGMDCRLVRLAANGQEVMEELQNGKPDILILDIQMPGLTGIDLAKYVWENKLPCRVILLTAYADFSYAQQAIKYDVVDYVIKTGAFDDLVTAVEKAKAELRRAEEEHDLENQEALRENFFKSVFDGSLYQEEEIRARARQAGISLEGGYFVTVVHFRPREDKQRDYEYSSLKNFFSMVFEHRLVYSLVISRDVMAVILDEIPEDYQKLMQGKCAEVAEMMDNFMKLYVYIGVSGRGEDILELKKRYQEAEYAEGASFFNEKSKINFYTGVMVQKSEDLVRIEKEMENLTHSLRKGSKVDAFDAFASILECQEESGGPVSSIVETGLRIYAACRKLLAEHDQNIHDIVPCAGSISKRIYSCRHLNGYYEIMRTIIGSTADHVSVASSNKSRLIYECRQYIDEHYEENLTVSEISRHIGVSLSYLSRVFKASTGNTIINYINEKKIEKAKDYLANTDMKIYEIADKLGFENTTYFSYFFKKYTGMSPKDYKEN